MAHQEPSAARAVIAAVLRSPAPPLLSWREMKAILTAALLCETDAQRAAVIERFCGRDAQLKQRLLAAMKPASTRCDG